MAMGQRQETPRYYSSPSRRVQPGQASSLSLVRFDGNDYSVPTAYAHHQVTAVGGMEEVRLAVGNVRRQLA